MKTILATIEWRTLAALVLEWCVISAIVAVFLNSSHYLIWTLCLLALSTRQHALLMLYHDAVHGLVAQNQTLNDALINLFVGIPSLLPVEFYRPLHIKHHNHLGEHTDPERQFLYINQHWNYKPLPALQLLLQLLGDLFLINGIKTIIASKSTLATIRIKTPTIVIACVWFSALITAMIFKPTQTISIAGLWILALVTVTNLLQKIRSFAEHSDGSNDAVSWQELTYSWQCGWIGRCTIWPYNINRHREHHSKPTVPWFKLPEMRDPANAELNGKQLWRLLLNG